MSEPVSHIGSSQAVDTLEIDDRGETYCVVGAGPSGLAATKNLRAAGFAV